MATQEIIPVDNQPLVATARGEWVNNYNEMYLNEWYTWIAGYDCIVNRAFGRWFWSISPMVMNEHPIASDYIDGEGNGYPTPQEAMSACERYIKKWMDK